MTTTSTAFCVKYARVSNQNCNVDEQNQIVESSIQNSFITESLFEEFGFHHFYEEKWNEKSIPDFI